MRFFLSFLSIIIGAAFAQIYFPWWTMAIVCFLIGGLAGMNGVSSFFTGFLAVALLWGGFALFLDMSNDSMLSGKMAQLLGEGMTSTALLLISAALGGLVGGMACMTGSLGRWMFR